MFRNHVNQHLSAYYHGELKPDDKRRVESHFRECPRCLRDYEEIRFGARLASSLTPSIAPESIWNEIHNAKLQVPGTLWVPRFATVALAVAAVCAVSLVSWILAGRVPVKMANGPSWQVETLRGNPQIGNAAFAKLGRLRTGETLQTDASSEAEVRIADIGRLTVDPNTKLRLLVTKSDEHRIALEHGKVEATVWAPPRLFIVDTPSARAIDLGCQYTLEVQKDGSSLLHVTLGMVSLDNHARESFVPAGAFARTRAGAGPGTPFHDGASQRLQSALDAIDFGIGVGALGNGARERMNPVDVVLEEVRERDAVTLWHLLSRVDVLMRGPLYDKLAKFAPPPENITRSGVIALDPTMLRAWGESIPELWWMKQETK